MKKQIGLHEAGHGIVAAHLGFVIHKVFTNAKTVRSGGVNCGLPGPDLYENGTPEQKADAAVKNIAVFSAGKLAETWFFKPREDWSEYDDWQIGVHAIRALGTPEEQQKLLFKKGEDWTYDADGFKAWAKHQQAQELIAKGKQRAEDILKANKKGTLELARLLENGVVQPAKVYALAGVKAPA
jgi:hypothetical protein